MNLSGVDSGLLRRLFSTRVLKDIARGQSPCEIDRVREHLDQTGDLQSSARLRDIYDAAFLQCRGVGRGEHVYKNALVEKIVMGRHSLRTASVHFEVRMRSAKLDVLIAREFLSAYEIKTELDELSRLSAQVEEYRKFCRDVWVLTCEKHLLACERQLPYSVGLAVLTKRYQIRVERPVVSDSGALDVDSMLRLLRKQEQLSLLQSLGVDTGHIPNTLLASQLRAAAKERGVLEIQAEVANALRARGARQALLAKSLPRSLAASVIAQDLTIPQQSRLIEAFKE